MGKMWTIQSNLSRGELAPGLVGRTDLQAFYSGVGTALNVLVIPQGGLKKRPGMEYLATALGDGRLENFSFSIEQSYTLAFTNLKMQIFKDGVLQTNINGSGDDFIVTPWTLAQIADIDYIQSADTAIVTHPGVAQHFIGRDSDTDWTIAVLPLTNIPQFDFNDASSPTPVSAVQQMTFSDSTEGDLYKISLEGILSEELVFAGDQATNQENIRIAIQDMFNTGKSGISVGTSSPTVFAVTFAGDSAKDWDLLTVVPVTSVSVNFKAAVVEVTPGTARTEDVWSATRGWPITSTFHEARLWFGGSSSRPATLWGSNVNDFFNFDPGKARDDEAITATLNTDQVNAVQGIFSNRSLQVFTSGGEFYAPESPLTPENISFIPQSNLGSKRVRPVTIDGVTLFLQRTGKSLVQFVFINEFQANQSRSVSVLAPQLIKNPVQMQVSRGTEDTDANYVYITNDDGTLTVFNTLAAEEIQAFTRWETEGNIKSAAVVDNKVNFLVERVINGSTVYFIERENKLLNTDAATITSGLASDTLTGLSYLDGETITVKADGAMQANELVASGSITIENSSDTIEAGIFYAPKIVTMPLNIPLQNGPNAAAKKKIGRVGLNLFESIGVIVNEQRLADKTIGVDQFDAPQPHTGFERIHLSGWSIEALITITQDTAMPMTILSIAMEVSL